MDDPEADTSLDVDIYQFKDLDQYLNAIKTNNEIPSWSYYANRNQQYDIENMMHVGTFEGLIQRGNQYYLYLPSVDLDAGYYVFRT